MVHCSEYILLDKKADSSKITSLLNQISVTAKSKTLYTGSGSSYLATMKIELPTTLEVVSSLKNKTSQTAVGGVTVSYKSSNSKVVTVDKNGKITAKGVGKATISTTIMLYSGKTKIVKQPIL